MMKRSLWWVAIGLALSDCGGAGVGKSALEVTLSPPPGTPPAVAAVVEEGNRLFEKRQWEAAKAQYEAAIKAKPTLAEAHYNLGLVYDALRNDKEAYKHFIEAANLAPGNKEIWNSPPLRMHGDVIGGPKSGIFAPDDHRH
jgi:tetratricopeptide (TPR) repeat protein